MYERAHSHSSIPPSSTSAVRSPLALLGLMTSEAVVSLFTTSLAETERALAEESAKLASATTRICELEMELLLARAETDKWRNRFEHECERRAWDSERRELQSGLAAQQSRAGDNPSTSGKSDPAQPNNKSEEASQEPSPSGTPLKPNDPTPLATSTVQEPRSLSTASLTVVPVTSPPPSAMTSSHRDMSRPDELPHSARKPALPRVEQLGAMMAKVYIEQERYETLIVDVVGRVLGPGRTTLKSIETATGCALNVFCDRTVSQFRGPPYVLVQREGPACLASLAKVHDAIVLVQQILTPPLHGRDELWLRQLQQLQQERVLDAERDAAARGVQQLTVGIWRL